MQYHQQTSTAISTPIKLKLLYFPKKKDHGKPVLIFENFRIKIVDQTKHLGITLGSAGQWNNINHNSEAASKIIHIMRIKSNLSILCKAYS